MSTTLRVLPFLLSFDSVPVASGIQLLARVRECLSDRPAIVPPGVDHLGLLLVRATTYVIGQQHTDVQQVS